MKLFLWLQRKKTLIRAGSMKTQPKTLRILLYLKWVQQVSLRSHVDLQQMLRMPLQVLEDSEQILRMLLMPLMPLQVLKDSEQTQQMLWMPLQVLNDSEQTQQMQLKPVQVRPGLLSEEYLGFQEFWEPSQRILVLLFWFSEQRLP